MALEDAGGADRVIEALRFLERLHAVVVRKARRLAEPDELGDRLHLLLDEDAGRIAVTVLLDGQRLHRRSGVAGNAGALERLGVGARHDREGAAPKAPDRADIDWVV